MVLRTTVLPKLIQFQICKPWTGGGDYCIFALGEDGRIYVWHSDSVNKGWFALTNILMFIDNIEEVR